MQAGGYIGKILNVNFSDGKVTEEALDVKLCREFIGGYGIGARIIYDNQRGRVDPLGPENILGFATGPLTGASGVLGGTRFAVMAKSPLTGTWGDANCGGYFGPTLKFAGYDAIFFNGVSEKPVYLLVKDGKAQLKDATHLWGKDTYETESVLKSEWGKEAQIASIGPAGEKLSLISSIIHNPGRAAARSGLGAVMGSKRLKAVVVMGKTEVPVAHKGELAQAWKEYTAKLKKNPAFYDLQQGLCFLNVPNILTGNAPIKNFDGIGVKEFPDFAAFSAENVLNLQEKKFACWRCPIACGGLMKAGKEYKYAAGVHKPEYETFASFGMMCLNSNVESIIKANDICNRYGLDTISTGATIAFAIECYENGLITKEDTDGIELTLGNHRAIIDMTEKLAKRQGFGDVLADGVRVAAESIGKGADRFAFHVHGQELPMHDPRFAPSFGAAYIFDATPGRHTQAGLAFPEEGAVQAGLELPPLDKYIYTGKGHIEAMIRNNIQLVQASGMCFLIGYITLPLGSVQTFLRLVTGWERSPEELSNTAERILAIRQAFNLREGFIPKDFTLQGRPIGQPPQKEGPQANVTVDVDTLRAEYYKAIDWDPDTGNPSKRRLIELGLDDIAAELYPQ